MACPVHHAPCRTGATTGCGCLQPTGWPPRCVAAGVLRVQRTGLRPSTTTAATPTAPPCSRLTVRSTSPAGWSFRYNGIGIDLTHLCSLTSPNTVTVPHRAACIMRSDAAADRRTYVRFGSVVSKIGASGRQIVPELFFAGGRHLRTNGPDDGVGG